MVGNQFTFVQGLPIGRSKREYELEQAKARSHAAKVVHQRTKDTKRTHQQLAIVMARKQDVETRRSASGLIPSFLSLRQGNSDPFGAYSIPIDSKINALMKYTRELYLPTLAVDATNQQAIVRPEDWKECVGSLTDICTAYAHMTRVAAFMTMPGRQDQSNESMKQSALVFNGKGTSLLRERIEQGIVDQNTLYVISCFLAAEVYARNFEAARFHARMLGKLFPREDIPVNYSLLHSALRLDSQLAVMSLTRPSFDHENWMPEVFIQHFSLLLKTLPESINLTVMGGNLDNSIILDERLKDCFVKLRQALVVYLFSLSDQRFAAFEYNLFIRHVVFTSMGRFVDHYLDAEEILHNQITFGFTIIGNAQVQAYTSLAATMWLRRTGAGERHTAHGAVIDTGKLLMSRLREKLEESDWMVWENAESQHSNVRLWSIFVGADQEQADSINDVIPPIPLRDASKQWFNVQLARQASAMGLFSWEQVHGRLLRFLHTDVLKPHGSEWFPKTMEANA